MSTVYKPRMDTLQTGCSYIQVPDGKPTLAEVAPSCPVLHESQGHLQACPPVSSAPEIGPRTPLVFSSLRPCSYPACPDLSKSHNKGARQLLLTCLAFQMAAPFSLGNFGNDLSPTLGLCLARGWHKPASSGVHPSILGPKLLI